MNKTNILNTTTGKVHNTGISGMLITLNGPNIWR